MRFCCLANRQRLAGVPGAFLSLPVVDAAQASIIGQLMRMPCTE
jgi:hypothetical protein